MVVIAGSEPADRGSNPFGAAITKDLRICK